MYRNILNTGLISSEQMLSNCNLYMSSLLKQLTHVEFFAIEILIQFSEMKEICTF